MGLFFLLFFFFFKKAFVGIFNNLNIWSEQKQKRHFFNLMSDHITLCWFILHNVICCRFLISGLTLSSQLGKILGVQIWWWLFWFFNSSWLIPFSSFWQRFFVFRLLLPLGEAANRYNENEVLAVRMFLFQLFLINWEELKFLYLGQEQ